MNPPQISVLIPRYNYARFLGEAMESVLAQDYPDFEMIVADDCSADNTAEVVLEMWFHLLGKGDLVYTGQPLCAFRPTSPFHRLNGSAGKRRVGWRHAAAPPTKGPAHLRP